MPNKFDLSIYSLRQAYSEGELTPAAVVAYIQKQIAAYEENPIWIHVLSDAELKPYLDALQGKSPADLPLYGVPFAIKDNIDLAGIPTTAACREYAYIPNESAFVVQQLLDAGAIPIGKTNLDQFATGLVGTRSPYGAVSNAFSSDYISGGSSSGSSVAVALGLVTFALGTDTAGSGRVPAAFNNLVGLKPSRGLWSNRGVVPACLTLDCVTVFTLNPDDAEAVHSVAASYDRADAYARHTQNITPVKKAFRFGIPKKENLQFFGNTDVEQLFYDSVERLKTLGGEAVEIDMQPFLDAAKLLYEGPWVAERYAAIEAFIQTQADALYPTTRAIIEPAIKATAVAAFKSQYKLQAFKKICDEILASVDFMVTPTAGTIYTIAEVNDDPIKLNSNLGYYTNFMNLLDYSAIALPAGMQRNGLPAGITLFAPAFTDNALLGYSKRYCSQINLPMGNTGFYWQPGNEVKDNPDMVNVVVCGAHLSGLPLNYQLSERNAQLVCQTTTAAKYRLYALPDAKRPGMVRDEANGTAIEVEVWQMPLQHYGSFVAGIAPPLGIGTVELADGSTAQGFICEAYAVVGLREISEFGGWRAYLST